MRKLILLFAALLALAAAACTPEEAQRHCRASLPGSQVQLVGWGWSGQEVICRGWSPGSGRYICWATWPESGAAHNVHYCPVQT